MSGRPFHRVGVLMGGRSSEREVSLRSGAAVAAGLRSAGYEVTEVVLEDDRIVLPDTLEAVFIALHGRFGEDGTLQALLKKRGVPYTGSGPEASRRAFDKRLTKQILLREKIPTPEFEVLRAGSPRRLPLPVVIKPAREGSSIGVHRVFEEEDWPAALADALQYDEEVIVERFIEGRELTVGLVGEETLPVLEIRPPQGFYNYRAKYTSGQSEYLVPAPIPDEWASRCRALAWRTFRALGAEGMGRVDLRMAPDGTAYVLELNTIPGFTETSLLPKAARAAGLSFPALCDRIMCSASVH